MKPFTRTIIDLFDGKRRYLIPLYQRQYAWSVGKQLELLWADIARVAEKLKQEGHLSAPHFMGAMVITQLKTFGKSVQAFEVIDGQQRLTTFQILLAALREVSSKYAPHYAAEVSKYLLNDGVMELPEVERFKLWPSRIDRPVFRSIIDQIDVPTGTYEDAVARPALAARSYFVECIEEFVAPAGAYDEFNMEKLFEALRTGLAVVSIELEGGDDPQTIFETLNSRGEPLTASDLMRNSIFQRAAGSGQIDGSLSADALYEKYWLPLDAWFWREGETRGRLARPRLDWLLADHLTMRRGEFTSVEGLYATYKRWIADHPYSSVEEELQAIAASAAVHRRTIDGDQSDPVRRFGKLTRAFDVSVAMPLVLYLIGELRLEGEHAAEALGIVESFIVRRDICGLGSKSLTRFFAQVIAGIRQRGGTIADLRAVLEFSDAESARWPSDEEFSRAWCFDRQYKSARQIRLRYILEQVEHVLRTRTSEIVEIKSDLTVEHIMPQQWRTNWPLPSHLSDFEPNDPEVVDAEFKRERAVHTIGNLTLLTHVLNSSVSNGSFHTKLPQLKLQSSLVLNRDLHRYDSWDETDIERRAQSLFACAREVWRGPQAAKSL